ncbi:MAG: 50S ribosomal protein L22 [Parcubacteria group bacterium]|nr:50S ribosomal protein L22 [Parcubacteria group bacterium]
MQSSATLRNLRIAPRKVRLVADLIRGKSIREAEAILRFTTKKGTDSFSKLLKAAAAAAKLRFEVQENQMYIEKLTVDEGSKLKRRRARSRGQAFEIQKKTSHITLVLGSREELKEKKQESKAVQEAQEVQDEQEQTMKDESRKQIPRAMTRKEVPKKEQGMRRMFRRKSI